MVKIRLARHGTKKRAFYRVVAVDERKRRDGRVLENLGQYQPVSRVGELNLREDRILEWLSKGAQPSPTAKNLLSKTGILKKYLDSKKAGQATPAE